PAPGGAHPRAARRGGPESLPHRPRAMTSRVRIAPSPTGPLPIGAARTALYNFLHAHHVEGTFILRLEDTDRVRSTVEFEKDILEGLHWLRLPWGGGTGSSR